MDHPMITYLARTRGCRGCGHYAEPRPRADGCPGSVLGECRVSAPRTSSDCRWPKVLPDDWCGQWSPMMEPVGRNGGEEQGGGGD